MKLDKPILMPDRNRKPFFDGANLESQSYDFECTECGSQIVVNCFSIYVGAWDSDLSEESIKKAEEFFSVNKKHNISLERGWPSFTKHYCSQCGTPYLVIADFHEYRNSVYHITMQGIAKCW